jgi:hypothetical protein
LVSYLIEWTEYKEALIYLEKCDKIAQFYKLRPLEAKLVLLRISLICKKGAPSELQQLEELLLKLHNASKIFTENKVFLKYKDALAESLYLQGII